MNPKPLRSGLSLLGTTLAIVLFSTITVYAQNDLTVLDDWFSYTDVENSLYHELLDQAHDQLDDRQRQIEELQTTTHWRSYRNHVRSTLRNILGPFPDKTPLRAEITDTLQRDRYRVEHLVFQSLPGFYVTASLFVPDEREGKTPAILFCSGHSRPAHRRPYYQQAVLNLVRKGFVVLAMDPIGQGERLQYYNPNTGESEIGGSIIEHSYPAAQTFVTGTTMARYMIWDGIRAIDYLTNRDEVDANRIGVHGLSGGGTQTAYIAAVDKRVQAAAPAGYITRHRRLLEAIGPQDGEQNFYRGLERGITMADLLLARAPKPTLIMSTTRDFFSIEGARAVYQEVKEAYAVLDRTDHLGMTEDDHGHGYTPKNLESMYAFFQQHLNHPGSSDHLDVNPIDPDRLQVTPTGQVLTSYDSETIYSLHRDGAQDMLEELKTSRENGQPHIRQAVESARKLSGYEAPGTVPEPRFAGRYQRDGYAVEKYLLETGQGYPLPYLLFRPMDRSSNRALVYLHPEGKAAEGQPGEEIEWFVEQGYTVLAPDVRGTGELAPGLVQWTVHGAPYQLWFASVLTGQSIVGLQSEDISRMTQILQREEGIDNIDAVARGTMAPVMLHSAAFNPTIDRTALIYPLISYRALIMDKRYAARYIPGVVAGALPAYDLPDLAASLAPKHLLLVNVRNEDGDQASDTLIKKHLEIVRSTYANQAPDHLTVRRWQTYHTRQDVFGDWVTR